MRATARLRAGDVDTAKSFYTDYLGLSTEGFNMGWVASYASPDAEATVQLVTRDAIAPEDSVTSANTDDTEAAYEEAQKPEYEIVHPITTEPWGVRRFFVRAPDGKRNQHREPPRLRQRHCDPPDSIAPARRTRREHSSKVKCRSS